MREFIYGACIGTALVIAFFLGAHDGAKRGFISGYLACQSSQEEEMVQAVTTKVTYCESRDRHDGVWGKAGEYGVAQFKPRTFIWMSKMAGHPEYNIKSKADQLALLEWAIRHGYGNHWSTCYKRAVTAYIKDQLSPSLSPIIPQNVLLANFRF